MSVRPRMGDESVLKVQTSDQYSKIVDRQEYFPEELLLWHLLMAYEHTMTDELPSAMEHINKAEQSLADIKPKLASKNSARAIEHLVIGTKCHVLEKLGQLPEMVELLDKICTVEEMNDTELATLYGCQCLILNMSKTVECSEMIICAKKAVKYDPDNGKWHFLLGGNYRFARKRDSPNNTLPDAAETSAFEVAYNLFPNALFGVTLARLYRESRNYPKANKIYKKVYDLQPTSCQVLYQLALGFIRSRSEKVLAKHCLDRIAEKEPDSIRYSHYMGIYEEKCNKDFKAALRHYKNSTENYNHTAEWQYVECRKKVEPHWYPLPYMSNLLEKYSNQLHYNLQDINIKIGLYYLFDMNDVLSACPYLTDAIEMNPNAKALRDQALLFRRPIERVNVYQVLVLKVQLALKDKAAIYDDDNIAILKNMLELCGKYFTADIPSLSTSSQAPPQSSQWLNSNRNYD